MSMFRNLMLSKAARPVDYIRLNPEIMDFDIQQETKTLDVESNSDWNINIK